MRSRAWLDWILTFQMKSNANSIDGAGDHPMKVRTEMTATEPILLCWSGGKDSSLALAALRDDPAVRVVGLLTSVTAGYDRISMHGVRRALLHDQAAALGLPLFEAVIPAAYSNHDYEQAMAAALAAVRAEHPSLRRV